MKLFNKKGTSSNYRQRKEISLKQNTMSTIYNLLDRVEDSNQTMVVTIELQ